MVADRDPANLALLALPRGINGKSPVDGHRQVDLRRCRLTHGIYSSHGAVRQCSGCPCGCHLPLTFIHFCKLQYCIVAVDGRASDLGNRGGCTALLARRCGLETTLPPTCARRSLLIVGRIRRRTMVVGASVASIPFSIDELSVWTQQIVWTLSTRVGFLTTCRMDQEGGTPVL